MVSFLWQHNFWCNDWIGRELAQVDEPPYRGSTTIIIDFEAYPEPKILSSADLDALYKLLGTNKKVANHIGAATNFVSERRRCKT